MIEPVEWWGPDTTLPRHGDIEVPDFPNSLILKDGDLIYRRVKDNKIFSGGEFLGQIPRYEGFEYLGIATSNVSPSGVIQIATTSDNGLLGNFQNWSVW